MNEAKHLLERAAYLLGFADWVPEYDKLRKEIENFLSIPEPEVKREALTPEDIDPQVIAPNRFDWCSFWDGIRFAEKHHGIGGGDE